MSKRIIHGKEFQFYDRDHLYTWGGQAVPGVTTILKAMNKPEIIGWAVKVTRNYWLDAVKSGRTDWDQVHKDSWKPHVSKAAANIGTNVHKYAEAFLKNQPLPELLTDEAKRSVEAFHKWLDAHKVELVASEQLVFSRNYFYAGTCDLIAKIDGVLGVGDFKTSTGIYPDMRFQTAAYQQAIQEESGQKFEARWVFRFDKTTGNFEVGTFRNFELDFAGFLGAHELYKALDTIKAQGKVG